MLLLVLMYSFLLTLLTLFFPFNAISVESCSFVLRQGQKPLGDQLRPSNDCQNSILNSEKIDSRGYQSPPLAVERKAQKALVTIISTKPHSEDLVDLKKIDVTSIGTGFSVQENGKTTWLTASHVTDSIKSGHRLYTVPFATNPKGFTALNHAKSVMYSQGDRIDAGSYTEDTLNPFNRESRSGNDFAQFSLEEKKLRQFVGSTKKKTEGLSVRNLQNEPIAINEPLFLFGLQRGRLRKYSCVYRGSNSVGFCKKNRMEDLIRCRGVDANKSGSISLGGVSGGVVLDMSGQAVSIFNGRVPAKVSSQTYLRVTPLYSYPEGGGVSYRPYPSAARLQGRDYCFNCYSPMDAKNDGDFLEKRDQYKKTCHVSFGTKISPIQNDKNLIDQ